VAERILHRDLGKVAQEKEIMSAARAFFVRSTFSSFAARFPIHDMAFRAAPNDQSMVGFGRDKTDG
jgi:hypothetical protein